MGIDDSSFPHHLTLLLIGHHAALLKSGMPLLDPGLVWCIKAWYLSLLKLVTNTKYWADVLSASLWFNSPGYYIIVYHRSLRIIRFHTGLPPSLLDWMKSPRQLACSSGHIYERISRED